MSLEASSKGFDDMARKSDARSQLTTVDFDLRGEIASATLKLTNLADSAKVRTYIEKQGGTVTESATEGGVEVTIGNTARRILEVMKSKLKDQSAMTIHENEPEAYEAEDDAAVIEAAPTITRSFHISKHRFAAVVTKAGQLGLNAKILETKADKYKIEVSGSQAAFSQFTKEINGDAMPSAEPGKAEATVADLPTKGQKKKTVKPAASASKIDGTAAALRDSLKAKAGKQEAPVTETSAPRTGIGSKLFGWVKNPFKKKTAAPAAAKLKAKPKKK